MKLAVFLGFPLSFLGLVLYFPPLVRWLTLMYGEVGRLGGVVTFAVGWSLLLAYLAFNLGMENYRRSQSEGK
jgi:hypothetical protein